MKKIVGIFIFLVIVALGYFMQKDYQVNEQKVTTIEPSVLTPSISETIEPSDGFVEKTSTFIYYDQEIQYLIIFPAGYTQTTNRWPMILFLHGGSLRGQDLELVKSYGSPWVAEQSANFPFVVLAPQCPEGEDWMDKSSAAPDCKVYAIAKMNSAARKV